LLVETVCEELLVRVACEIFERQDSQPYLARVGRHAPAGHAVHNIGACGERGDECGRDDPRWASPSSRRETWPRHVNRVLRRRKHHARSVLCIPLLKQTRLTGIIYLENNLTSGAFTPARVALLEQAFHSRPCRIPSLIGR